MKKVFGALYALTVCFSLSGCGGSGETESVVDGASQTAVEQYEAAIAAEEAAMDADPPTE